MNRDDIKTIIPHREPMLLLDEVNVTEDGQAIGRYTIKGDEFFLQGHYPGHPIVPGVMLCEMMAQTCCVLLADKADGLTPYFTGLDKVKFRQKVLPGDTVTYTCSITKNRGVFYFAQGKGEVGGKLAVSADFSFALVKEEA